MTTRRLFQLSDETVLIKRLGERGVKVVEVVDYPNGQKVFKVEIPPDWSRDMVQDIVNELYAEDGYVQPH